MTEEMSECRSGGNRCGLNPVKAPPRIRIDRNELAGAFGDIGTDLPLIVGMILASGIDGASVLGVFGLFQVFSALVYGLPMAVQPLKAVAAIVIVNQVNGGILFGAGLAIGLVMLALTLTGWLEGLARLVPKPVIRGIQFGLGLQLALLALGRYVPAGGPIGFVLAGLSALIVLALWGNRKCPASLLVVALGVGYAALFHRTSLSFWASCGLTLPQWHVPHAGEVLTGFVMLALPQIPLSLGNSILATRQIAQDYFPDRPVTVSRLGLTYSILNLTAPFLSGIPVCHGSGGIAGHYTFGARTGGSVLIYGLVLLTAGLLFSRAFTDLLRVFPLPVLGTILFFEAFALMRLLRDLRASRADLGVAVAVGLMAAFLPYGYLAGLVAGSVAVYVYKN